MLKSGANLLLLDERPTIWTSKPARAELALEEFAGCAMTSAMTLVPRPHATHMLAFEGDSHVEWFERQFRLRSR